MSEIHFLSLGQTKELSYILETRDWGLLEEFIVEKGYDESTEDHMDYETITVQYEHRFARVKENAS